MTQILSSRSKKIIEASPKISIDSMTCWDSGPKYLLSILSASLTVVILFFFFTMVWILEILFQLLSWGGLAFICLFWCCCCCCCLLITRTTGLHWSRWVEFWRKSVTFWLKLCPFLTNMVLQWKNLSWKKLTPPSYWHSDLLLNYDIICHVWVSL